MINFKTLSKRIPTNEEGIFYKSIIIFSLEKFGVMSFGTEKPVIITSTSDSIETKFNSIALACLT